MPRPGRPGRLWRWSVGILAAAVGVNLAAPSVVAAGAARSLRAALATNHVDVVVESDPAAALWWGRVDRMDLDARDVPAGDLRLERFSASLLGLLLDTRALYAGRAFRVRRLRSGTARAWVSQEALAGALARQPGLRIDALVLRRGGVTVRGAMHVLGAEVAVEGDGSLLLNGRDGIDLIVDRATVTGVGGPSGALKAHVVARVPSVVRVPPLPLGFRVTAVHMEDGRLLLDASSGPR